MTSNQLHINQLSLNVKMLEKIWKPDTYFHNGLDSYLHTITRPNKLFRISENGDITYSMRSLQTLGTLTNYIMIPSQTDYQGKMSYAAVKLSNGLAVLSSSFWFM